MLDIDKLTVDELNNLTAAQTSLLLVRLLNTSDLAFFHMLFKTETLADIIDVTSDLVRMEFEAGLIVGDMSDFKTQIDILRNDIANRN